MRFAKAPPLVRTVSSILSFDSSSAGTSSNVDLLGKSESAAAVQTAENMAIGRSRMASAIIRAVSWKQRYPENMRRGFIILLAALLTLPALARKPGEEIKPGFNLFSK